LKKKIQMPPPKKDWLDKQLKDPEFQRHLAREDLIEDFLIAVEGEMLKMNVSRAELARRMGCTAPNVTQLFRRTKNLTAASMVDITHHLDLRLELSIKRGRARQK
jgi:hypothetical protein